MTRPRSRSRSRRRSRPDSQSLIGLPIGGFSEAVSALLGLEERFGRFHAGIVLDGKRRLVDAYVLTGEWHAAEDALAMCLVSGTVGTTTAAALLLSGGQPSVEEASEADLERFRSMRSECEATGLALLDWIVADGDLFRSYAITECGEEAWPETAS